MNRSIERAGSNWFKPIESLAICQNRLESLRKGSNLSLLEADPFGINLADAPRAGLDRL